MDDDVMNELKRMGEDAHRIAEASLELINAIIDLANLDLQEVRQKESEAYDKVFSLVRKSKEIDDRIKDAEYKNRCRDSAKESLEKDLQKCKPWEFSKKHNLQAQVENFESASGYDAEPMKLKLKETQYECSKANRELFIIRGQRKNLEDKLKELQDEKCKRLIQEGKFDLSGGRAERSGRDMTEQMAETVKKAARRMVRK